MMVLATQLDRVGGHPSGFDYLRFSLAAIILAFHGPYICYVDGEDFMWQGAYRPIVVALVPGFFVLSGFLVAGSLERNRIPAFISLRIMRIFPALIVEVLLSALVIGPLVTTLPPSEYFSHPDFFRYFLNTAGDIHFYLPGVFVDHPVTAVNMQLWTVPSELNCYLVLVVLSAIGVVWRPKWLLVFTAGLAFALTIRMEITEHVPVNKWPKIALVLCFLIGVSAYRLRHAVPYSPAIFVASIALYTAMCFVPGALFLAAFPLAYVIIFLGLQNPARIGLVSVGSDYSYGLYLYGFPIQQLLYHCSPMFRWAPMNIVGGFVCALGFAFLSWHLLEKRALSQKKRIVALASRLRIPGGIRFGGFVARPSATKIEATG